MPETMDWNSVQTWERLVACILASGVKLDLNLVASYYGTTYWALQNKFRKIKKDADQLKPNVEVGEDGKEVAVPVKAPKTPRKPKTPKKDQLDSVKEGRVSKKKSPTKKSIIKEEPVDDDVSDGDAGGNHQGPSALDADDMFT